MFSPWLSVEAFSFVGWLEVVSSAVVHPEDGPTHRTGAGSF
jgi:hypothetical protein